MHTQLGFHTHYQKSLKFQQYFNQNNEMKRIEKEMGSNYLQVSKSEKKLVEIVRDHGICKMAEYKWRGYRFFSRCRRRHGAVFKLSPFGGLPSTGIGRDRDH